MTNAEPSALRVEFEAYCRLNRREDNAPNWHMWQAASAGAARVGIARAWLAEKTTDMGTDLQCLAFTREEAERAIVGARITPLYADAAREQPPQREEKAAADELIAAKGLTP